MLNNKSLVFFLFSEGFIVLTLQILVFVVLTPYWGQTYSFWVLSLFMSMFGLALGYFLTPFIIHRHGGEALKYLRKNVWFLLLYMSIIYGFNLGILEFLLGVIDNPVTGALISLIFFFFIPTVLLGMIPIAFIQHVKSKSDLSEGEASGNVFSISSIGGILGVLLVAHVMLPLLGKHAVILVVLVMILVLYLLILRLSESKKMQIPAIVIVGFAAIVLFSQGKSEESRFSTDNETVLAEDGILGKLSVINNHKTKTRYLLVNNNIQSMVHFTGRSLNPYVYSLSIYASYFGKDSKVLVAGLGCGSLPYELSQMGYKVDVVDIDMRLHEIVQEHFLVSRSNPYNFFHSDVRRYVQHCETKYKSIFLDISHGENIPVNVYTVEGLKECAKLLDDDGLMLIHFLSSQDKNGEHTLGSLIKTIEASGLNYKVMNFLNRSVVFDFEKWNGNPEGFILAVSKNDVNIHEQELIIDPSLLQSLVPVKDSLYLEHDFNGIGEVLTDDKSNLEYYHNAVANKFRKLSIKELQSNFGNE